MSGVNWDEIYCPCCGSCGEPGCCGYCKCCKEYYPHERADPEDGVIELKCKQKETRNDG